MFVDIKKYEALAKLTLTDAERELLLTKTQSLMAEFDLLSEIDTQNAAPMHSPLNLTNVMREDVNKKTISREELLKGAPQQQEGYFVVPRTID
jgi:aspartyl-tRNA(Asn)/glutamyl-tRNA(Gln) amidotransferase subunit C